MHSQRQNTDIQNKHQQKWLLERLAVAYAELMAIYPVVEALPRNKIDNLTSFIKAALQGIHIRDLEKLHHALDPLHVAVNKHQEEFVICYEETAISINAFIDQIHLAKQALDIALDSQHENDYQKHQRYLEVYALLAGSDRELKKFILLIAQKIQAIDPSFSIPKLQFHEDDSVEKEDAITNQSLKQNETRHNVSDLLNATGQLIYNLAIEKNKTELMRAIEEQRLIMNKEREVSLPMSIRNCAVKMMDIKTEEIIDNEDYVMQNSDKTVVCLLAQHGESEAVDFLIENFDASKSDAVWGAVMGGHGEIVKKWWQDRFVKNFGHVIPFEPRLALNALRHQQYGCIDLLLELGSKVSFVASECLDIFTEQYGDSPNMKDLLEFMANFASEELHRVMAGQLVSDQDAKAEVDGVIEKVAQLRRIKDIRNHYTLTEEQAQALEESQKRGLFWLLHGMPILSGVDAKGFAVNQSHFNEVPLLPAELYLAITSHIFGLTYEGTRVLFNEVNGRFDSKHETYKEFLRQQSVWATVTQNSTANLNNELADQAKRLAN